MRRPLSARARVIVLRSVDPRTQEEPTREGRLLVVMTLAPMTSGAGGRVFS